LVVFAWDLRKLLSFAFMIDGMVTYRLS
jgi:hypothetical protein